MELGRFMGEGGGKPKGEPGFLDRSWKMKKEGSV